MKLILLILFTLNSWAGFTPFPPSAVPPDSITSKGNLLTSNGAAQAEFSACADGYIIEWDSAEAAGFKCVTPSAGGGGTPVPVLINNLEVTSLFSAQAPKIACSITRCVAVTQSASWTATSTAHYFELGIGNTSKSWQTSSMTVSGRWVGITYSSDLNLFVAVAQDLATTVATSPDGLTWTSRTIPTGGWRNVTSGGGKIVIVGNSGSGFIHSSDGITWSASSGSASYWALGITYSADLSMFLAVSYNPSSRSFRSVDGGATWVSSALPAVASKVAWNNGVFVYIPDASTNTVYRSADGISWTSISSQGGSAFPADIIAFKGYFVVMLAVGGYLKFSRDGVSWQAAIGIGNYGTDLAVHADGLLISRQDSNYVYMTPY